MSKLKAFLLLGPPGSGKTPLGEYLAGQKFAGGRAFHFDFGQQLRDLVKNGAQRGFTPAEIQRVEEAIKQTRLFEREDEDLVKKIMADFVARNDIRPKDWIVLNGLPRHVEQVKWVCQVLEIRAVVNLVCPLEISRKRILSGVLEDRSERSDDSPESITARYRIYLERTVPLINFFLKRKIPVVELSVLENTTPAALWKQLVVQETFMSVVSD